jgi:hypothetical protein
MNSKLSDDGCVGFYNAVKNTAKLPLETLILRGNTNLSQTSGKALEKLCNIHRSLKRVDLSGTSVPSGFKEKIKH